MALGASGGRKQRRALLLAETALVRGALAAWRMKGQILKLESGRDEHFLKR